MVFTFPLELLMKIPILFLVITFAHAMVAMQDKPQSTNHNTNYISTLRGTIAQNAQGGRLECSVTHDSAANTYSGTEYNHGYSPAEWFSSKLSPATARRYYQQLLPITAVAASNKRCVAS